MVMVSPIRNEEDYRAAMDELDALLCGGTDEVDEDKLDVLTALIHSYEQQHHRPQIGRPEPIEVILFVMEQRGLSRSDLQPMIGERGRISDVLNRRRPLTIGMIRRLSAGLNIPADLLIAKYPTHGKVA